MSDSETEWYEDSDSSLLIISFFDIGFLLAFV